MPTRGHFILGGTALGVLPVRCRWPHHPADGPLAIGAPSELGPTRVRRVGRPRADGDVADVVHRARAARDAVSVATRWTELP